VKPPSSIVVGPYTYSVIVDLDAVARASHECGSTVSGNSNHARQEIALEPELGPDATAEVLTHEVVHCLLDQAPLELSSAEEERIARAFGYSLLELLRRNPELVAFLTQAPADPTRAGGRSRHGRTDGRQRAAPEGP
jgi:hypothetical protein